MLSRESICAILYGSIGSTLSVLLFLVAPMSTIRTIWRNRSVEQFSPIPYLVTLLNCMINVIYPNNVLVVTNNSQGLVILSVYIAIFIAFSPHHLRVMIVSILVLEVVIVGSVQACVLVGVHTQEKRQEIVSILSVIFGIAMYAAPLLDMRTLIQTKNVKYMPIQLCFINFLNGICWIFYSLLLLDYYTLIVNGIGVVLSAAQLILYFKYRCITPRREPEQTIDSSEKTIDSSEVAANLISVQSQTTLSCCCFPCICMLVQTNSPLCLFF